MNAEINKKMNIPELIFQILLVFHFVLILILLFFMFYVYSVDIYFGLITKDIFVITLITFLISIFLFPINKKYSVIKLLVYIIFIMIVYSIFLISSSLIRDIPAYFKDDYKIKSGIITDVDFKYAKGGNYYINEIYIDDEKYHYNLYNISKEHFEENWGLDKVVTILYLKHSKEIEYLITTK